MSLILILFFNSIIQSNCSLENNESTVSSCTSSGIGSTIRTYAWTPPYSIGTATPTHTEGTPSLTESSESECNFKIKLNNF